MLCNSDFPKHGTVQFIVHTDRPVRFALRVRIPSLAVNANRVTVNGMENETKAVPNTWMTVTREWQDGDTVTIELPYALSFKSVDAQHPEIVAFCYGPLVLCCNEMTVLVGARDHPEKWLLPVEGEENTFRTLPGHSGFYSHICRTFKPYFTVPLMQWYYMYNKLYPDMETLDREHQGT